MFATMRELKARYFHIPLMFLAEIKFASHFISLRVMMVPQTVVYFTAYDQLKTRFGLVEGQQNIYAPMCAGMSARGWYPNSEI